MGNQLELTIQEPCHENWDAMTPSEQGRFCLQCQKQVVDFTNMSDRQLAEFFKKPSAGSVCGRFMTDQLDRDIEIPKKRIPWIRYFFQFTLPAFLLSLKTNSAKAQGRVTFKKTEKAESTAAARSKNDTLLMEEVVITTQLQNVYPKTQNLYPCPSVPVTPLNGVYGYLECGIIPYKPKEVKITDTRDLSISALGIKSEPRKDSIFTVTGVVKSERGELLPGATVMNHNGHTGVATNDKGEFSIKMKTGDSLVISYIGYYRKTITDIQPGNGQTVVLMDQHLQVVTAGMVLVVKKKKKKNTAPLVGDNNIQSPSTGNLKIFPNPLLSGQPLKVECRKTEPGTYSIQLLALSGQSVYMQVQEIGKKGEQLELNLPSLHPGEYILLFTHQQSGKKYSSKLIIQ